VCLCLRGRQAVISRSLSEHKREKLAVEIAALQSRDVEQLKARWRVLYAIETPSRIDLICAFVNKARFRLRLDHTRSPHLRQRVVATVDYIININLIGRDIFYFSGRRRSDVKRSLEIMLAGFSEPKSGANSRGTSESARCDLLPLSEVQRVPAAPWDATLAQPVEQLIRNQQVVGSNPTGGFQKNQTFLPQASDQSNHHVDVV
jgi:hypothetical protein